MQLSPQQGEVDELRAELRAAIARAEAAEAASAASGARGLSAPQIMRRELTGAPASGAAPGAGRAAAAPSRGHFECHVVSLEGSGPGQLREHTVTCPTCRQSLHAFLPEGLVSAQCSECQDVFPVRVHGPAVEQPAPAPAALRSR